MARKMRILLSALVAWLLFAKPSNSQELPPVFGMTGRRIQLLIGDEKLIFREQIQKVFERDGLNRKNADLLEYLFQSTNPPDFREFERSTSKGLRLATAWHLVKSQAFVSARLMHVSEAAKNPIIKISPETKSHFLKVLSHEIGFDTPEVINRHFDGIEIFGSKCFMSLSELQQNPQRLDSDAKSKFVKAQRKLGVEYFPSKESSIAVDSKFVAFATTDGPVVQELDGQNKPIWSGKLDHSWGDFSFRNYEFVIANRPETDNLLVFVSCTDRFAINVLERKSGDLIWSFCSNWPLVP